MKLPKLEISPEKAAKVKRWSYIVFICVLAVGAMLVAWKVFLYDKPVKSGKYETAAPAKGMAEAPKHDVVLQVPVKALDKKVAAKKMKLPPEVIDDPIKELVSTASMGPSDGGYTTATVIDTSTGEASTIVREEKRPFWGFGGKTSVGAGLDISTRAGQVEVLEVNQDLLRMGSVQLTGRAEAKFSQLQGAEATAGLRALYSW